MDVIDTMGDLEDSFLKKNVPGRYTSWSEENDDGLGADADNFDIENGYGNDNDSEDDEYYLEGLPPLPGKDYHLEPSSTLSSNGLQKSCNTGVKGVLSDYRDAHWRGKEETRMERLEEVVTRKSHNRHRRDFHKNHNRKSNSNDDGGNSDEDRIIITTENGESDGENSKYLQHPTRTTLHPFYRKSHYPKVTPEEYVQLLDEMENDVHQRVLHVVVHLYESSIPECRQLHSVLKQMKSESVTSSSQFIEVDALDANPDMDTIILPTILIYDRRGKLVHNLVRFTDDLPPDYTAWELGEYFDKLGIIV